MKHLSSRIAALIGLYICIIFGIFVIQFTKGKTFSLVIGPMSVSGRHEINEYGENVPLLPLHIVSNGLDFYISDQNPITAEKTDGQAEALKVLSYKNNENSFIIECSGEISVRFVSGKHGDIESVTITAELPETVKSIAFPWKLTQTARLERQDGKIFLRYAKQQFVFSEGLGFENSAAASYFEAPSLLLSLENPSAYYHTYIPSKELALEAIPANPLASDEKYAEIQKTFSEAALNYFANAIEAKTYNEKILTAYIAEKGKRGEYGKALKTAPANLLTKAQKTYLSSPFYNNITENHAGLIAEGKNKKAFLSKEISANSFDVFTFRGLIPYLMNTNNQSLAEDLKKLVSGERPQFNPLQAAGILEVFMDYALYFPEDENVFEPLTENCLQKIKEALLIIDGSLFISASESENKIQTQDTLYISKILIRYGNGRNTLWKAIGQMLCTSLFRFSGDAAALPAGFTITGKQTKNVGLMVNDEKILYPEDLYPEVIENTWYPHEKSLVRQAEKGFWAWTAAEDIEVMENTSKVFAFKVKFIEGGIHHLVITGVRPFYNINISGVDFRSDPRFEIYNSSGYVYNQNTRTLYLKLRHKQIYEEIKLSLGTAPVPKAVPVVPKAQERNLTETETEAIMENSEDAIPDGLPE